MVGLPGQRMAATARAVLLRDFVGDVSTGVGSFTASRDGWYEVYVFGPGGRGGASAGSDASHGGGGGATMARIYMLRGQVISYLVGRGDGGLGSSTATLPDGRTLTGVIGGSGNAGFAPGGVGMIGTGGDINRRGGNGFGWTNPDTDVNTNDGVPVLGGNGEWGGVVGLGPSGGGPGYGGGGGAGFSDIFPDILGNGASSGSYGAIAGTSPGGGGLGNVLGGAQGDGGSGAVIIVGYR